MAGQTAEQEVMSLSSSVAEPLRTSTRPATVAPVRSVMSVSARMLPWNAEVVFRVAELPICQNTLQGEPPLITCTREPLAAVSALPI